MAVLQGSVEDVWEDRTIIMEVVGELVAQPALVEVCMDRKWKAFVVPCHDHLLELLPGGQDEAIAVDFEEVESVIVREADRSIASPSQQMIL